MPIIEAELSFRYTGGGSHDVAQTDPDLSLGNYRSSTVITTDQDNNLFDDVSGDEASVGMIDYRAVAFLNTNSSLTLFDCKVWITVETGNLEDEIFFDVEAPSNPINGDLQNISNETNPPTGLSGWSQATTKATGKNCPLVGGDVGSGEWFGVWYKREISVGAVEKLAEEVEVRAEGFTESV